MGLFKKSGQIAWEDIVSVVLLEQTQITKSQTRWGLNFENSALGDPIVMDGGQVPIGMQFTFSVTLRDGSKHIVKEMSGTAKADKLLQMAMDPPAITPEAGNNDTNEMQEEEAESDAHATEEAENVETPQRTEFIPSPELGRNQLSNGKYIIGIDIPAGKYDLLWISGNDTKVRLYKDKAALQEDEFNCEYFQWIGSGIGENFNGTSNRLYGIECEDGKVLWIDGNAIVEIRHSQKPDLVL